MPLLIFSNFTKRDKTAAIDKLISGSTPSQDFFFMVILSILTATLGLLLNDVAIIIGSMLIAPILYPILSLALGVTLSDYKLISRSFWTLVKSYALAITAANLASLLLSEQLGQLTEQIVLRAHPSLVSLIVAVIVGFAASFALVKQSLSETLPGVAISVSVIPPMAVTGIGISRFDWTLVTGSFLLFMVNLVGVIFASMITFSLMNFYGHKTEADKKLKSEQDKIERDRKKAKKK